MTTALDIEALPLMALRLRLRFEARAPDASNAAEMWRGALKHALSSHYPDIFRELHDPESVARARGEPDVPTNYVTPGYALRVARPGLDVDAEPGEQWLCLTLFGRAHAFAHAVLYGLLKVGAEGVGGHELRFRFDELQRHDGDGWQGVRLPVPGADLRHWLWRLPVNHGLSAGCDGDRVIVALYFTQRLVVKHALQEPPSLWQIVEWLLDRANQLALRWGEGPVATAELREHLLRLAGQACPVDGAPAARRMHRVLPAKRIDSSGLVGLMAFRLPHAAAQGLMPLLRLGTWLHVGTQTTIGAGHYRLIAESA